MRKVLGFLTALLIVSSFVYAEGRVLNVQTLKDQSASTYGYWDNYTMTAGATQISAGIPTKGMTGYAALLTVMTGGSVTISFDTSLDNVTFYTPYDSDGNDLSSIASSLTASRWVEFDPTIAPYIRFKYAISTTDTAVTSKLLYQEEYY